MNRIQDLRTMRGLSMKEASRQIGIPYTTYVNYEKGLREPNSETLISLANFYGTTIDYLLGKESVPPIPGVLPVPKMQQVPLLGTIACGDPILAEENMEGFLAMPEAISADFALRCRGDSMINARIFDGDIVYIRQQSTVDDGEIAAVLIDNEATLKRVHFFPDRIALEPANPMYPMIVKSGEEMATVRILGKAVAFTSAIR